MKVKIIARHVLLFRVHINAERYFFFNFRINIFRFGEKLSNLHFFRIVRGLDQKYLRIGDVNLVLLSNCCRIVLNYKQILLRIISLLNESNLQLFLGIVKHNSICF